MRNLIILSAALFLAACPAEPELTEPTQPEAVEPAEPAEPEAPAMDEGVAKAVELAKAIQAAPDNVDAILSEHGTTAAELEALLYEIAADPKRSAAYAAGLK